MSTEIEKIILYSKEIKTVRYFLIVYDSDISSFLLKTPWFLDKSACILILLTYYVNISIDRADK